MEYERQRAYDILLGAQKKADEAAIALLKLNKLSLEEISSSIRIPLEHVKELAGIFFDILILKYTVETFLK